MIDIRENLLQYVPEAAVDDVLRFTRQRVGDNATVRQFIRAASQFASAFHRENAETYAVVQALKMLGTTGRYDDLEALTAELESMEIPHPVMLHIDRGKVDWLEVAFQISN